MPQFLILLILLILSKNAPAKTFDVDISTGRPAAANEAYYHGETIEFRAVRGRSVVTNVEYSCVYYQTNGMDQAWWKTDGLVFHPTNDVGAASYRFFLEGRDDLGRDWHANGLLRLLPSPGFVPNEIAAPVQHIDFATVDVDNAPWALTNDVESIRVDLGSLIESNTADISTNAADIATLNDTTSTLSDSIATNSAAIATLSNTTSTLSNSISSVATSATNYTDRATTLSERRGPATWTFNPSTLEGGVFSIRSEYYEDLGWNWFLYWTSENGETYTVAATSGDQSDTTVDFLIGSYMELPDELKPYYWETVTASLVSPELPGYVLGSDTNHILAAQSDLARLATNTYTKAETDAAIPTSAADLGAVPVTRTVNGKALSADVSLSASDVGAATAEDVYRIVAGTNVILIVTNYNSAVHAPAMKLQHLDPQSGQYVTYWDETRRHGLTLTNAMHYTDAQIETRAPRAWSGTTSGLGSEAPAGVTWISTPETVIAGGFEYEKVVTSAGAVWVLASNGLATGATTNSFFRVSASDGTELFSIEKTDSYLVGVNADGITRSGNTVTIPMNVVANEHPYIRATTNIVDAAWVKEDENGFACPWASVSWSGTTGAYVATVTCSQPSAFFYFEYLQEGGAKVRNSAATELAGGIIFNGDVYMPTVNGNKLEFVRQL